MTDHREDHGDRHQAGGPDPLTGDFDLNARVAVRKNSTGTVVKRRRINTIEGTAILLTLADDSVNEEADLTIAVNEAGVTHNNLGGLTTGDPHTQYTRKDTLTTRGDLYVRDATTVARKALGAANTILNSDGTDPQWGSLTQAMVATGFRLVAISSSAPGSPAAYDLWFDTTNKVLKIRNSANAVWIQLTPKSATVATSETTTSTTYADLTTAGPSVTIDTGTEVLVTIGAVMSNSNALIDSFMAPVVSGASTIAAADGNAVRDIGQNRVAVSRTYRLTGLTAGSNTFKAQYKNSGGGGNTLTALNRDITIEPLIT